MQTVIMMPWKPEYSENRRRREAQNPELRERRIASAKASQERNKEERKEYLARYYRENPEKYKRTQEQKDKRNAARRKRYREDMEYREKIKEQTRVRTRRNPNAKKEGRLKSQYGIDLSDYSELMAHQGGKCAICGHADTSNPKFFPMVDHCHKTGAVRGILCSNCNQGLGKFLQLILLNLTTKRFGAAGVLGNVFRLTFTCSYRTSKAVCAPTWSAKRRTQKR